jgi:glycosyltransferase involved in cell wall biosynthesis
MRKLVKMRRIAKNVTTIVSNPSLQRVYGGSLVPHVREDPGMGSAHVTNVPTVAFVGTNRKHKGVDVLRSAISALQPSRARLIVTDVIPSDPHSWETWVGPTSQTDGFAIVAESDIVAIPSRATIFSRGQLPAKIVDAMLSGRPLIVSDFPPLTWAMADGGLKVKPNSVGALKDAILALSNPTLRAELGAKGRERALQLFTVSAVAPVFETAVRNAIIGWSSKNAT